MTDTTEALPPLLPCPMCGEAKGYTLSDGSTYRWWDVSCAACGREIGECASDRRAHLGGILPDRWKAADEAWNDAAAHAESLRAALAQRQQVPERRPDGMPASADERYLRRLLAVRSGIFGAYFDDGEAQWQEHGIVIDFMREPVADIDAKLRALNVARAALTAAPSAQAEPVAPAIPEGWVPLRIEWEPGYAEDVAFGPKHMMDRLKKWLDAHYATKLAAAPTAQAEPQVPQLHEALLRLRRFGDMGDGYSAAIMLDVREWIDAGMAGPLPDLPEWAKERMQRGIGKQESK